MQSQFENKHYVISLRKRRLKQKVKNKFFYNADDTSPTNDKNLKYSYTQSSTHLHITVNISWVKINIMMEFHDGLVRISCHEVVSINQIRSHKGWGSQVFTIHWKFPLIENNGHLVDFCCHTLL